VRDIPYPVRFSLQPWSIAATIVETQVHGDDGKLAATGRVRMLCLEPGATVAGEVVARRPAG
jgi:hypothetical protein